VSEGHFVIPDGEKSIEQGRGHREIISNLEFRIAKLRENSGVRIQNLGEE
jgi:hypothetical protein